MNKLILILLFFIPSLSIAQMFGEQVTYIDSLKQGDSTWQLSQFYFPDGRWDYAILTVIDSGVVGTEVDSIKVASRKTDGMTGYWSQVGLRNLRTFADVTVTNSGNGITSYLILDPAIVDLFIWRSNVSATNRRTIFALQLKR